ncbi:MAG: transcriptional repressor NrdR [Firmicutes bacterium]|nr:transcriptional repressor NrdR [Bacillota bacterium]
MKCPYCEALDTKVVDSRPAEDGKAIRRRRECIACGKRFTTYEKVEEMLFMVVKRDGSRESFDRNKILTGLMRACAQRPVTMDQMEEVASDIERRLNNTMEKEISTQQIGEMVMEELKELDEVAYVRFASVYRQFKDVGTFIAEIEKLLGPDGYKKAAKASAKASAKEKKEKDE